MKKIFQTMLAAVVLGIGALAASASYADYPTKPINLLVAYTAGGGADVFARKIVSTIEEQKGWKFVVQSATGASGSVMATKLKYAKPDGYTIGFAASGAFYLNPVINDKSRYQPGDFTHLAAPAELQMAVVSLSERGWKNLDDMAAYAKENGGLSVALQGEELKQAAETIAQHYGIELRQVPAKGGAGSIAQIMGKHIDLGIIAGAHVKYVESGDMVELGVLTNERTALSPNVMTLKEQGVDYVMRNYFQFSAPKGVSQDIAETLAQAIQDAMQSAEVRELAVERMRLDVTKPLGPNALQEFIVQTSKNIAVQMKR
ncbi:Bug family tripartite tricarboxylate transporter substrate binding protein [Marinobacterium rhizophilum]|uniref:Tripartite tricarboxylate transporter substrate binding protein n=1 Tax=Marinobacterium rhizophilum TaxID=420402 RepID=A0ABY5HHU4_9GAMM|nr:tripartite tricarboxylate transporter substrate binding protein [Marinobacterium rhizophilum]UTW11407.1 tripartite tricarboxylate transporter substrate binding protein [Marinobacterium rhizophilum]